MELATFKASIKSRVSTDTPETFRILDRYLNPECSSYSDVLLLNGQYNDISRSSSLGTMDTGESFRYINKIRQGLIDLIDRLTNDDIAKSKLFKTLVICKDETDKHYMQQYFDALPLHADVVQANSYYPPDEYSLVLFDAHTIGPVPNAGIQASLPDEAKGHIALLQEYLEKAPKWLLYYGEFNYILNGYRETTNAANNKFSLYARIKEMMDFIQNCIVGRTDKN